MMVAKIRCYPNKSQKRLIYDILCDCHFIKNKYKERRDLLYDEKGESLSANDFSKYVNDTKKNKDHPEYEAYKWMDGRRTSTKAIKDAICDKEEAYENFFKGNAEYPKFQSKRKHPTTSYFFIKDGIQFYKDISFYKNIIKIPILGKIRIKEKYHLPDQKYITSGRVVYEHGKYFLTFNYENELKKNTNEQTPGIGLDIGWQDNHYLTIYHKPVNGNKSFMSYMDTFIRDDNYIYAEEKINYYLRIISKKAEINFKRLYDAYKHKFGAEPSETQQKIMKGESYNSSKIKKVRKKQQKYETYLVNYSNDKLNKMIYNLVITNPEYISMEDLSVKDMLEDEKNNKLNKDLQNSKFFYFKEHLIKKSIQYRVEIRLPSKGKWKASNTTCFMCKTKTSQKNGKLLFRCANKSCDIHYSKITRHENTAILMCMMLEYEPINSIDGYNSYIKSNHMINNNKKNRYK